LPPTRIFNDFGYIRTDLVLDFWVRKNEQFSVAWAVQSQTTAAFEYQMTLINAATLSLIHSAFWL